MKEARIQITENEYKNGIEKIKKYHKDYGYKKIIIEIYEDYYPVGGRGWNQEWVYEGLIKKIEVTL